VIEAKVNNVEGAYYFKGYCLNKLGKRDEALAALAEIGKQFPQSKWLNDANMLTERSASLRWATWAPTRI
jgi:TolA-binding protein